MLLASLLLHYTHLMESMYVAAVINLEKLQPDSLNPSHISIVTVADLKVVLQFL